MYFKHPVKLGIKERQFLLILIDIFSIKVKIGVAGKCRISTRILTLFSFVTLCETFCQSHWCLGMTTQGPPKMVVKTDKVSETTLLLYIHQTVTLFTVCPSIARLTEARKL